MDFYADTADLTQIKKLADLNLLDGVTTNPSLVAKTGADLETRIKEIAKIISGPISVEVTSTNSEEMINQGKEYATWAPNVYVKLPMTQAGITALRALTKANIKTNVTLVFSVNQALIAAKAGATLISPFVGRLDDIGTDGMELVKDILTVFKNYCYDTKVLAASIRHPHHVMEAALIGAHIATIPPEIFDKMFQHNLTDAGQTKFLADWQQTQK